MSRVKQFLAAYCKERSTCGYVMLPDPLSSFYEAVCVGLDWEDNVDTDDLIPEDSGFLVGHNRGQSSLAWNLEKRKRHMGCRQGRIQYSGVRVFFRV
ncbi:hypothetical protein L2E82_02598 [Cichorium intybus]|uniref:Uncharacterized protein n=1 Tax=Cichorium intybus TaxID=13427 RepID=A0ACB9H227_CICIN|nr:hypothetical protein L2E82_02598 [Cichorium intybus]